MSKYMVHLYRYIKINGWEEEQVFSNFASSKEDGFGVIPGQHNSALYKKKYETEDCKR